MSEILYCDYCEHVSFYNVEKCPKCGNPDLELLEDENKKENNEKVCSG